MSIPFNTSHKNGKSDWLHERFDLNTGSELKETLLICTTPRVGSHFLSAMLASNEYFGKPFEYFLKSNLNNWQKELNLNTEECFDYLIKRRTTKKGLFSVKSHWRDFNWMLRNNPKIIEILNIKYYIFLHRKDVLEQAISYEIAQQSGSFISFIQKNKNKLIYNKVKIRNKINLIKKHNQEWENYFENTNVKPLFISYEDFLSSPKVVIQNIFKSLGLDQNDNYINDLIKNYHISSSHKPQKQASLINLKWKKEYLSTSKFAQIKKFMKW